MTVFKNKMLPIALLLCAIMLFSACSTPAPDISSPRLVQMDGFNVYLGQKESEVEKFMEPGSYAEYEDGGNFTDYPEKSMIIDYSAKGLITQIRVTDEGTLYNGIQIGMTRDEVSAIIPNWSFETSSGRLRTEYSKDDDNGALHYYIEYRFNDDDQKLNRIYINYSQD